MILLASGKEIQARFLKSGMMLKTQHADTMEWGAWPVSDISAAYLPVFRAEGYPRATGDHPFWINGAWVKMSEIGQPDGKAWVSRITVSDAHTYISAGILSHNKVANPD